MKSLKKKMDEVSESESQGRNSKVDEDGSTIPAVITDEFFEEIACKCRAVSWKIIFIFFRLLKFKLNYV